MQEGGEGKGGEFSSTPTRISQKILVQEALCRRGEKGGGREGGREQEREQKENEKRV